MQPDEVGGNPKSTLEKTDEVAMVFAFLAGILLPAITLAVELASEMCAANFFDPVPTMWHGILIAFVPLANWQAWRAVRQRRLERERLTWWANAVAIGIALYYTAAFTPLMPLSVVGVLFGIGLLPLAPFLSLIAAIYLRRKLKRIGSKDRRYFWRNLAAGVGAVCVLLCVIELPSTITRVGMRWATADEATTQRRGMRLLHAAGSHEYVLRACYERTGQAPDPLGFVLMLGDAATPEQARQLYYRLTSEAYDSVPAPRLAGRFAPLRETNFDFAQGGEIIGGRLTDLHLQHSQMNGSIDADAGVSYTEWTMVFRNDSNLQREARATVELPTGGVVSRLTLWINGEPREAAFAERRRVREAYESIVRQRRDPVLVTTAGANRVLVQCFPVPPRGDMKIRFGITAPLAFENRARAALRVPQLVETNFRIADEFQHQVWFEAKRELASAHPHLSSEQPRAELYAVRGSLPDKDLREAARATLKAARDANITVAWTQLKDSPDRIRYTISEQPRRTYENLVVVLDGSHAVGRHRREIADALQSAPPNFKMSLIIADDDAREVVRDGDAAALARAILATDFHGGKDNVPALEKAWDVAATKDAAILWLHTPPPVLLSSVDSLRQRWERRPRTAPLVAMPLHTGANRVLEKLDDISEVTTYTRTAPLSQDLPEVFNQLNGAQMLVTDLTREKSDKVNSTFSNSMNVSRADNLEDEHVKQTSAHLARLWAYMEVKRLIADGARDEAARLAATNQLVTPVSGAVVLETREQYERAGLKPVEPGSVPSVPEPETVVLMVIVVAIAVWSLRKQLF